MSGHTRQRCPLPGPMSSHTRQHLSLSQVLYQVTLHSAFRSSRSNVGSHSTALFVVLGLMSSHTRQRCPLPSPMSSHTQQRFPPFQVQCRVTLDNAFRRFRSNVEPHSTLLSSVPSPMSSSDLHVLRCSLSFCNLVAAFRL